MKFYSISFVFALLLWSTEAEDVTETEMFSIAITPKMFNWTYQEFDKQYSYHPSLLNKPDLPNWLHYVYSVRHHSGFIYGTPPQNQKDIVLEIVALNKENYETRRLAVPLRVLKKNNVALYQVQMKIDNLNVEDLLDEYRMERLKDIFRKKLWRESSDDLYGTFMASAIELGARLPLRPNEGEGVVLKLGSHLGFSAELLQLREEVRPLSRLGWCPRDFKRTTVERLFRDAGFNLDWCSFRLLESPNPYTEQSPHSRSGLRDHGDLREGVGDHASFGEVHRWMPPSLARVPQRSYAREFTLTVMLPVCLILLLLSVLSLVLCFQHQGMDDSESDIFFRDIFHICTDYMQERRNTRNLPSVDSKVELSHYHSDASGTTVANAGNSAANLNLLGDDLSNKSGISPNNNQSQKSKNLEVDYNRPQPPPYLGSNTNSLVLRQRQMTQEDLVAKTNRARSLEESLQILNEANIANRPYHVEGILFPDGMMIGPDLMVDRVGANSVDEDYVLIKPETELSLRRNNKGVKNGQVNKGNNGF